MTLSVKLAKLHSWQAGVLGVVQGLTEFLPVSSTAHLNLFNRALRWNSPGLVLDTSLHLGTLLATLVWAGQEQWQHLHPATSAETHQPNEIDLLNFTLLAKVAVATLPAGLAGLFLDQLMEKHWRSPAVTAAMLMLGGGLLWWIEHNALQARDLEQISWSDALWIGLAQALALLPGLSRSGITLTAGLWCGLKRPAALRFSFLQSIPIVAASGAYKLRQLLKGQELELQPLLVGAGSAAVSGYLCLEGMLHYFRTRSLKGFALYRLLLGAALLYLARRRR